MYICYESRGETGKRTKGKRASRGPQGEIYPLYIVNFIKLKKIGSKQFLGLDRFSPLYMGHLYCVAGVWLK